MRTGQWVRGDELFNVTDSILLLLVSFKARHVFLLSCCTDVCLTRVSPGRKDIFLHSVSLKELLQTSVTPLQIWHQIFLLFSLYVFGGREVCSCDYKYEFDSTCSVNL